MSKRDDYDSIVMSIYDCAANPELWPDTLGRIRDRLGMAYAVVGLVDNSPTRAGQPPLFHLVHSDWDHEQLMRLPAYSTEMPGLDMLAEGVIDKASTQLRFTTAEQFATTRLAQEWAFPQGLVDSLGLAYMARDLSFGIFSAALHRSQGDAITTEQCRLAERLSPHIRRAMAIIDMTDHARHVQKLYKEVLDRLDVAVFIVGPGRHLVLTNAAGDRLLSEGRLLTARAGVLAARHTPGAADAISKAIELALKGDSAAGISGIGIPLVGDEGERAAAYVLPLAGADVRGALGRGQCIMFVGQREEQQPFAMEMLRTLFDLTQTEARVALLVSRGGGAQGIADILGVSTSTIRTHLIRAYSKTGTTNQASLGSLVHRISPPIRGHSAN